MAGEFPLGAAIGNEHGDFTQAFTVPVDLPEGVYKVLAKSSGETVVSPPLTISGPAVPAEDEGGHREEEEPLLAPTVRIPLRRFPLGHSSGWQVSFASRIF